MTDEASDISERRGAPDDSAQAAGETTSKSGRRFTARTRIIVALVVVVLGLAVSVPLALRAGTPPDRQPTLLMKRLWNISQRVATGNGDANAGLRQVVGPVAYDKTDALLGGGPVHDTTPVYLLEIRGNFVCGGCNGPPGASAPHGIAITVLLNPLTLESLGFGLGPRWLSLATLGKPFALPPPPDGAKLWTVPPDFARFVGSWGNSTGTLQLKNAATTSTLRWGGHEIAFQLTALASADSAGTATIDGKRYVLLGAEAVGSISTDDVGLAGGSRIVLRLAGGVGDSYLVVSTTPAASAALPPPLGCKRLATGASCESN
jgi:hypothetical protein